MVYCSVVVLNEPSGCCHNMYCGTHNGTHTEIRKLNDKRKNRTLLPLSLSLMLSVVVFLLILVLESGSSFICLWLQLSSGIFQHLWNDVVCYYYKSRSKTRPDGWWLMLYHSFHLILDLYTVKMYFLSPLNGHYMELLAQQQRAYSLAPPQL